MNKKLIVLLVVAAVVLGAILLTSCRVEPWMCFLGEMYGCPGVPLPNPYP